MDELDQLIAEDEMAEMVDAGVGSIKAPAKQPAQKAPAKVEVEEDEEAALERMMAI